jgi:hypothetical protein
MNDKPGHKNPFGNAPPDLKSTPGPDKPTTDILRAGAPAMPKKPPRQPKPTAKIFRYYLFPAAFFGGAAAIWFTWSTGASMEAMIFWPIGVMVIYIGLTLILDFEPARREQVADMHYYLGFLLTLVALSVSLYDLGVNEGKADQIGLTARIGVALVTSILGLLSRLMIAQFQPLPDDLETSAANPIAEAMQAITEASAKMSQASTAIADTAGQFATTLETNSQAMKESLGNIKQINANINRSIQASGKVASERLALIAEENAKALQQLFDDLTAKFGDVLEQLEVRIGEVDFVPDKLRRNIDESFDGLVSKVGELQAALSLAAVASLESGQAFGSLSTIVPKLAADLSAASLEIAGQKDVFAGAKADLKIELNEIGGLRRKLQDEVDELYKITETLYQNLTGAINNLTEGVRGTDPTGGMKGAP